MSYQNLRFFDNNSNELNLEYNSDLGYSTGNAFLPEISTGLYETLNIYVLEEVKDELDNQRFVHPISVDANKNTLKFKFTTEYGESTDIFLYSGKMNNGDYDVNVDSFQISEMRDNSYYTSIDPDGGPYLSIGKIIKNYKITKILSYTQPYEGDKKTMKILLGVEKIEN